MLHLLLDKGPWFRAKSFGYGSGMPIKWQGWLLVTAHVGLLTGISFGFGERPMLLVPLLILAVIAPIPLYAARTEGGWRWSWRRDETGSDRDKPRH